MLNTTWLSSILVGVRDDADLGATQAAIRRLLAERHRVGTSRRPADFEVQNPTRMLAMQQQTLELLARLGNGLAALALLVGGGGIFALMLTAVAERSEEIGLRMAVGARPRDVLAQFLAEAMLLSLGGWGAGVVLGAVATAGVALATAWDPAVPGQALLASLGMVSVLGLGCGAYPARRASLLPPIEALRRA
jgi:putative ABC transport system permease protein